MQRKSSGVVSLLELLKYDAHVFVAIAKAVAKTEFNMERAKKENPAFLQGLMESDLVQEGLSELPELQQECRRLMLDSAEDQIQRLLEVLSSTNPTIDKVMCGMTELQNRLDDQLARRSFYELKPDVAELFEDLMPFGASVANRFHIAAHNIEEAAKCYACERFDATTYHLMKVMEIALHCLAKRLHVSYSPNWGVYLDKIDKVLKSKARKSKLRKSRLRFLGNASALLRAVKEAWRDDSMHMGQKYGPDQARDIFMSVKAFMIHLSQELSDS